MSLMLCVFNYLLFNFYLPGDNQGGQLQIYFYFLRAWVTYIYSVNVYCFGSMRIASSGAWMLTVSTDSPTTFPRLSRI